MAQKALGKADSSTDSGGKVFLCDECDRDFESEHGLKQHIRASHPDSAATNKLRDFDWLWEQRWVKRRNEREIADLLDVTHPAVGYWLKKYGIGGRVHPYIKDPDILHDLYIRRDNTCEQLCGEYSVDRSTLSKYASDNGFSKNIHREGQGLRWAIPYIRKEYVEKQRSVEDIAGDLDCTYFGVLRVMDIWGLKRRKRGNLSGEDHPMWGGGEVNYYGPNWGVQRRRARERDGYKCRRCGADESDLPMELDVHHKTPRARYVRQGGDIDYGEMNSLENLISLCRSCHKTMERWPVQPD